MTPYRELTVAAFTEAVAAREPAPGGGAATAITTALGAGLVAMAARFSRSHIDDADGIAARADALRERALALADDDAAAYTDVLAAYRRPKEGRREQVRDALERASQVPLEIAEAAAEVAELAADVAARGNPNLNGDAATATHLAVAAARSAAGLVRINARLGDLGPAPVERAGALVSAAEAAAGRLTEDR